MSDIFLSYARADALRVEPLARALESEGWSVWWDPLIMPGQRFDHIIREALDSARCVIVAWSRISVDSNWVLDEAEEGAKRQILLPLLIEDVQIPFGFRRLQAVNLINWQGALQDSNLDKLRHALVALLGGPPTPAEPEVSNTIIKAPLPGILYRTPSPGSEPFVKVGDQVVPDTVVGIIETMGQMNEIQAGTQGRILASYVENGQLVDWYDPLFEISDFPPPVKAEPELPEAQLHIITSPVVGTFYRAPSSASEPFVRIGDQVEPDSVVCIIEGMHLRNEIIAETSGEVVEQYIENGQPVEYGQPLFGVIESHKR